MRRVGSVVTVLAVLVSMIGGAAATLSQSEVPTTAPLADLVAAIEAGTAGDLVVAPGSGPIVNQFQVVVNLGENPGFFDRDVDLSPVGFDATGALVDLAPFLGPNLELAGQIPPIAPSRSIVELGGQARFDLNEFFDGWEAFSELGRIDGPVPAIPTNTMLWGFELAEPFDTSCASAAAVGRAWESESLVSSNAPFDAAALDEIWPGTHTALADGRLGRLIQLNCNAGGTPAIETVRMNPDFGRIRAFGPLEIVALVKGNFVVFAGALRETEAHARATTFFATGAGGSVELVEGSGPIPVLVPNPYDAVPERIDFIYDIGSIEDIRADVAASPQDTDLLWRGDDAPQPIPIGLSCSLGLRMLHQAAGEAVDAFWQAQTSTWRTFETTAGLISSFSLYPDGSSDELQLDFPNGTFVITVHQAPGADAPDCRVSGTVLVGGEPPCTGNACDEANAAVTPDDDCDADCDVEGDTTFGSTGGEGNGGSGGGLAWPLYVVGAAAAGGGVALWSRGRKKTPGLPAGAEHYDRDAAGNIVLPENLAFLPDHWPKGCDSRFDPETQRTTVLLPPALRKVPAPGARQPSQGPDASVWEPEQARAWYETTVDAWTPEGERSPHIGENFRISNSKGQATVQQRVYKSDGTTSWTDAPGSDSVAGLRAAYNSMIENADLWNQNASSPDYAAEFARLSEGRQQSLIDAFQQLVNDPGLTDD